MIVTIIMTTLLLMLMLHLLNAQNRFRTGALDFVLVLQNNSGTPVIRIVDSLLGAKWVKREAN
jgi:hypothetical protein